MIVRSLCAAVFAFAAAGQARAVELPSFMQRGDVFCSSQADFDDLVAHGHPRAGSAIETCLTIIKPTRVAVMNGTGGQKAMVRVMNGPYAYLVGWTNGKLPLAQ